MRSHLPLTRTLLIVLMGLGLFSQSAPAQNAAAEPAGQEGQPAVDGVWPRAYETPDKARVIVYQPQISEWKDQKHMSAYAAVSYTPASSQQPALGTLKIEADTRVSLAERLVDFLSLKITESNFPTLSKEQVQGVLDAVEKGMPEETRVIALDRVLAHVDKSQIMPKNVEGVKADPPVVYFSTKPAVLVLFDGEPVWGAIPDSDLKYAINTNWDVFQHGPSSTYYLRNDQTWMQTTALDAPWTPVAELPDSFAKLPADDNWKEVKAAVPGKQVSAQKAPTVFVTMQPAELLLVQGGPKYAAVEGTGLNWVSNTESDVFRIGKDGAVYYLVAGRWFSAPDFAGPWTFATPTLPEDFKSIPLEHPRSRVLASIPGTQQAAEAVLLAQIPQTARVNVKQVKAPEVSYQGDPDFQPIEKTTLTRAVNTDKDILKVGSAYYLCYEGVWFVASSPGGPWAATTSIPGEIYTIPPSSPVYPVTYVTVVDDDATDEWATYSYTAGYTGALIAWGAVVYGSGHYYPPYVWYHGPVPIYYPHPYTYGCGAWYNPVTGVYGRGAVAYGPYGGIGAGAAYNPRTGTYARGAVAYGPYGAAGAAQAWNPRTGTYAATRQGANMYGSWGSTYVQRGDDWASTKRYTSNITGDTTRVIRTDEGAAVIHRGGPGDNAAIAVGDGGNVYAGKDGNVYRQQGNDWQKWDSSGWNSSTAQGAATKGAAATTRQAGAIKPPAVAQLPATAPAQPRATQAQRPVRQQPVAASSAAGAAQATGSVTSQLNHDSAARNIGAQRTQNVAAYQGQAGASRNVGSYVQSGGGNRGGAALGAGGGGRRGGGAAAVGGGGGARRGGRR